MDPGCVLEYLCHWSLPTTYRQFDFPNTVITSQPCKTFKGLPLPPHRLNTSVCGPEPPLRLLLPLLLLTYFLGHFSGYSLCLTFIPNFSDWHPMYTWSEVKMFFLCSHFSLEDSFCIYPYFLWPFSLLPCTIISVDTMPSSLNSKFLEGRIWISLTLHAHSAVLWHKRVRLMDCFSNVVSPILNCIYALRSKMKGFNGPTDNYFLIITSNFRWWF